MSFQFSILWNKWLQLRSSIQWNTFPGWGIKNVVQRSYCATGQIIKSNSSFLRKQIKSICIIIYKEEFIVRYITKRSKIMSDTKWMSIAVLHYFHLWFFFFFQKFLLSNHIILNQWNELYSNSSLVLVQVLSNI